MATLRTFIAIELDQELRQKLADVQSRLRREVPPQAVRWVRPEAIHLTLKFLGDTSQDQVEEVKEALDRAAREVSPFEFTVGGVGCFPNTRRPRVVWIGLHEPTGALRRLRDAVEAQVAPLGFPSEKRRFSPHLTLGRVHRRASSSDVRALGRSSPPAPWGTSTRCGSARCATSRATCDPAAPCIRPCLVPRWEDREG